MANTRNLMPSTSNKRFYFVYFFNGLMLNFYYRDTNVLPSFSEAIKSFNFIADKAEVTMREVNDWLKSKERFSTEFDASERIENHTRSNKTDYSYFPDSIDK